MQSLARTEVHDTALDSQANLTLWVESKQVKLLDSFRNFETPYIEFIERGGV